MYLEALRQFNVDKSDTNRSMLCDVKLFIKVLLQRKKHANYYNECPTKQIYAKELRKTF